MPKLSGCGIVTFARFTCARQTAAKEMARWDDKATVVLKPSCNLDRREAEKV